MGYENRRVRLSLCRTIGNKFELSANQFVEQTFTFAVVVFKFNFDNDFAVISGRYSSIVIPF